MLRPIILGLVLLGSSSANAQIGYITIEANGTVITSNEATIASIAGFNLTDYADLASYQLELSRPTDANGTVRNLAGGTVVISKPIGASSVLLRRAIDVGETISATVRFYGTNPDTGEDMEIYRAEFLNGYIAAITPWYKTASSNPSQLYEAVTLTFALATFEHIPTSVQHQIDFSGTQ